MGQSNDSAEERDERYTRWKSFVPVLYDWFNNHNLTWPSLSCRWGPVVSPGTFKNRQQLYLSEQTYGKYPNTLIVANYELPKKRIASPQPLSQFNESAKSAYIKIDKTLMHPGEVNKIRELPQNKKIVATHTDLPDVYIWNLETQKHRPSSSNFSNSPSVPDLVLTGHTKNAEFALAMSPAAALVLSGGKDRSVLLWDIEEPLSSVNDHMNKSGRQTWNSGGIPSSKPPPSKVPAKGTFKGHHSTVEDVQFRPSSLHEFCSVGDDKCLIFWDARASNEPAAKVEKAHEQDIHCVDWNALDENFVLTGSADASIKMFDRRKPVTRGRNGVAVATFEGHHSAAVLAVQWCPDKTFVFGSSAEDGLLNVWDFEKVGKGSSAGLFFQHAGHRSQVVDFHWNPSEPWTLASVSEDAVGGGTLQIWRISDLIYRPEEEVLAELENHRDAILAD